MSNKKIINIVKGDISLAINAGTYTRNTNNYANIEFDTKDKLILLDGVPYSNPPLVEITYSELKQLKDDSLLTPGSFYKITDYVNTTNITFDGLTSNEMDIIVLALFNDTLSEEGWAIIGDDKYKVWYSLDNDTARFSWADDTIDETVAGSIFVSGTYGGVSLNNFELLRNPDRDYDVENIHYYWYKATVPNIGMTVERWTTTENVTVNTPLYDMVYTDGHYVPTISTSLTINSVSYSHEGTGEELGHGVIYRITDESGELCKLQWNELKTIRDSKALVADTKYRIVDYQCTTTQENTQSAGHQFDIVLLALSENKLAEEGWAMMHDNIYDVTFDDGVTKKCYLYYDSESEGFEWCIITQDLTESIYWQSTDTIIINEETKTAICRYFDSDELNTGYDPDTPLNYFQNSNLSAWKVWYCLDNDTARFAWANTLKTISWWDERAARTYTAELTTTTSEVNGITYYKWEGSDNCWTTTTEPLVGGILYDDYNGSVNTNSYYAISATSNGGTGVIYRLIDEWNNDCPYDFKNILMLLTPTPGITTATSSENIAIHLNSDYYYRNESLDADVYFAWTNGSLETFYTETVSELGPGSSYGMYIEGSGYIQLSTIDYTLLQNTEDMYVYTFSDTVDGEIKDMSMIKQHYGGTLSGSVINSCYDNKITTPMFSTDSNYIYGGKQYLNILPICIIYLNAAALPTHGINIIGYNTKLISCLNIKSYGELRMCKFLGISNSTFGSANNLELLEGATHLNYGNGGVELATKDDLN